VKQLLASIFVVSLGAASSLLAQHDHGSETAQIAGAWQVSFELPHGPVKGTFKLEQDGANLKGNCDLEGMGAMPITGKVDGHNVTLTLAAHGGEVTITLNGAIQHDKISGTINTPASGSWTATKQ
jgi:hypothetical protein